MALPASAITPACCRTGLFESWRCRIQSPLVGHVFYRPISAASISMKSSRMEPWSYPPKFNMYVDYAAKKLREITPDSIQSFPWAHAENAAMQQVIALMQEALKWSLITFFILSSISDIIYAISRNKELLIPFGLFSGCAVADFLKEASREYLHHSQEKSKTWPLFCMGCLFVLVRIIAIYCSAEPRAFLLLAANGGLMHVLWQWKSSSIPQGDNGTTVTLEDEN